MSSFFTNIDILNSEAPIARTGIYTDIDFIYAYSVLRKFKPKNVLELGCREGKVTSAILSALHKNNIECTYYGFEKDPEFKPDIEKYVNSFDNKNIKCEINDNILNYDFSKINNFDAIFIDGNHDYILAKWYVDVLFRKLNTNSIIHIHDMYYNHSGHAIEDITSKYTPQGHEDIASYETIKRIYPKEVIEKYVDLDKHTEDKVNIYEGDIVCDFFKKNSFIEGFSTFDAFARVENRHGVRSATIPTFDSCCLYFYIQDPSNLNYNI